MSHFVNRLRLRQELVWSRVFPITKTIYKQIKLSVSSHNIQSTNLYSQEYTNIIAEEVWDTIRVDAIKKVS